MVMEINLVNGEVVYVEKYDDMDYDVDDNSYTFYLNNKVVALFPKENVSYMILKKRRNYETHNRYRIN